MYTEDKDILKRLEESEKRADDLQKELDKLAWRIEPTDLDYSGIFEQNLIRSLLTDDIEEGIESIGGIDVEDEEGNVIDVDTELETFFDYEEERGVFSFESYKKVHFHKTNEEFVIVNTAAPGGSDTRIFRIKK